MASPLVLLIALALIVSVDIRIIAPLLPSLSYSLGGTPGTVGLAMTTYAVAYGGCQLVYGPLSDRYGRVAVVRLAGLGFVLCTALSALAGTTWQFTLIRLFVGGFAAATIPLTLVFVGDHYAYERRQVVLGRVSAVLSVGNALSASVGGTVAHFVSWRAMFFGYATLALILALSMFRLDPGRPVRAERGSTRPTRFADLLADPRARAIYLTTFVEGFLLMGTVTYLGSLAARRHGLDQLQVGLVLALYGVGTMITGSLLAQVRRVVSENALAATGGGLLGWGFLALIPSWPWPVFATSMFALGCGFVGLHTTLQLRGTEINPAARGKAFSLFAFSLFTGSATGTAVLGRLVDRGLEDVMLGMAGVGLVGLGLYTARPRRTMAS